MQPEIIISSEIATPPEIELKINCAQDLLARALGTVSRAVAGRPSLPVLANVLLTAGDGQLRLAGTNTEMAVTQSLGCQVDVPGSITVPARLLVEYISSLPPGPIDLETDAERLELKIVAERSDSAFKGIDAEEFPPLPDVSAGAILSVDPALLKRMIDVTVSCCGDTSRPVLAGVCISIRPDELVLAAADGYRLAVKRLECDTGVTDTVEVVVPQGSLQELSRVLGSHPDEVAVKIADSRSHIQFDVGSVTLISNLIEEQYPNFESLIPQEHSTRVIVPRGNLEMATRLAAIFARTGSRVIQLETEEPDSLLVSSNSAEVGNHEERITASIEGENSLVAFNSKFLSDMVGLLETDAIEIKLSGSTNPGLFAADADPTYCQVIMPMHVAR